MIDPDLANGPHDHDHLEPKHPQLRTSAEDLIQRLARIVLGADLRGLDETERRAMRDAIATIESFAAETAALRDELERVKADCHNWQQQAGYAETWNQEQGAMIRELAAENARLRDRVEKLEQARDAMYQARCAPGCRCDRDDVDAGCCFQCLFLDTFDDSADPAATSQPDAALGEPEEGGGLDPQRPHGDTGT